jgi:hypothetical protein
VANFNPCWIHFISLSWQLLHRPFRFLYCAWSLTRICLSHFLHSIIINLLDSKCVAITIDQMRLVYT